MPWKEQQTGAKPTRQEVFATRAELTSAWATTTDPRQRLHLMGAIRNVNEAGYNYGLLSTDEVMNGDPSLMDSSLAAGMFGGSYATDIPRSMRPGQAYAGQTFRSASGRAIAVGVDNPQLLKRDLAEQAGLPEYIDLTKPNNIWGLNGRDLLNHYRMRGFDGTMQGPKAKTSGLAQVFDLEAHPDIALVEFHPGGGTAHKGSYYKFDMRDGSQIKVIDPITYDPRTIKKNSTFFDQSGQQIVLQNGKWVSVD